jgi:hypothetical protein
LEGRLAPATLTVNTTADNTTDTSVLTLRDAITLVNSGGDPTSLGLPSMPAGWAAQINTGNPFGTNDTINFSISAASDTGGGYSSTTGVATISPQTELPSLQVPTLINGFSQPVSRPNTLPAMGTNAGDNAVRLITLDGTNLYNSAVLGSFASFAAGNAAADAAAPIGLVLAGGNSSVSGLVLQNFSSTFWYYAPGVVIGPLHVGTGFHVTSNGNTITGNYLANTPSSGVFIDDVPDNTVGGTATGAK